jgi:hypothetical protein
MVKSIELGNWEDVGSVCRENGLSYEDLMSIYARSIKWVDKYADWLREA